MILSVWRIVKRKYAKVAFTGEGARKYGGRWNSPGKRIVYTAQNASLAALEMLVHLDCSELLLHYVMFEVLLDSELIHDAPERFSKEAGDQWYLERSSLGLRVPSAVIPMESNILLNVTHSEFSSIRILMPQEFEFDRRLLRD